MHNEGVASVLLTFIVVSVVLTAIPGSDSLLVVRSGLRGRAQAIAVGAGTAVAAFGWGIAAAFGIAAILAQSAVAFTIMKLAGAVYLVFLGLRTLWSTRRKQDSKSVEKDSTPVPRRVGAALRTGLVAGLLNPKTGLFYVAVLPQILPKDVSVLSATLLFSVVDAIVVVLYTALLAVLATSSFATFGVQRSCGLRSGPQACA